MSYNSKCIYIECFSADTIDANIITANQFIGPIMATIGNPNPDPPRNWLLNYPSIVDGNIVSGDTVANALWKTSKLVSMLLPAVPPGLSTIVISISSLYTAIAAVAPYNTRTNVSGVTTPTTSVTSQFYDGAAGTLIAYIDGVNAGSKILTSTDDTGVYGALQIITDTNPTGFYDVLTAAISAVVALSPSNLTQHTYQMTHSITGSTNLLPFYVDNPIAPTTTPITIGYTGLNYNSGVPSVATSIDVTFSVANAVRKFYNSVWVGRASGVEVTTVTALPTGADRNEGSTPVFSISTPILPNMYNESATITCSGQSSSGLIHSAVIGSVRIDNKTPLESSLRVTSGVGATPVFGTYGAAYDSTESLLLNSEAQYLGGLFQYPPAVSYVGSVPVGPNYTTVGAVDPRYITFQTSINNFGNMIITIHDGVGLTGAIEAWTLQITVDNTIQLLDGNAAYPGVGIPSAIGAPCLFLGSSSATQKYITFGPTTYTSANVYVRVGLPAGSPIKFSNLTFTFV